MPRFAIAPVFVLVVAMGCASSPSATRDPRVVNVVAAENFWGNIAAQIGGAHAHVTSIISDPSADPHLYESDARDGAAIGAAQLVIKNGLHYDDFVDKLVSSSSPRGRVVVSVAKILGVTGDGVNPHLWYDVPRVHDVARAIEAQLVAADPSDADAFAANLKAFDASLAPVVAAIDAIKAKYPHAPVGYTERVPGYLLDAAGLNVVTPSGFASAIEDGNEPSPGDTQSMDALMTGHKLRVLLYNSQATSPVTNHVRDLARGAGIPVVGVTETMPSSEPDYQSWQLHQIQALRRALGG